MTEIGETTTRVDELIEELKAYEKLISADLDRTENVIACGHQMIVQAACPREVIMPKCEELTRVRDIIADRLKRRCDILLKSRDLMGMIEKVCVPALLTIVYMGIVQNNMIVPLLQANLWCAQGIDLLTYQRIEKCSASVDIAEKSLQEIVQFIASAAEFKLSSPSEFRAILEERSTPETRPLVIQVSISELTRATVGFLNIFVQLMV